MFSNDPFQDRFAEIVMGRVIEGIDTMRENLIYVLGEKSKLSDSSIGAFEVKVHQKLK